MADYDVIILGGGPGGYLAAERLGHAKKTVLLAKSVATTAYFTGGGPQTSGWGWPTAAQKFAKDGSSTIKFSKGTLTVSKTGKVKFTKK